MKAAGRQAWRAGWKLALAVLLLTFVFHSIFINEGRLAWDRSGGNWSGLTRVEQWRTAWSIGPWELWRTVRLVDPGAFLASIGVLGLIILLGIVRWRMALGVQGLDLSFRRTAGISLVAHFFNSFLLGSTGGDLMKAFYAARETHHRKAEAVVTVLIDRLLGLWTMLLFAVVMLLLNARAELANERMILVAGLVFAMLAALTVFLVLALWGGVSRGWPGARRFLRRLPRGELLERAIDSCREFGRYRGFLAKSVALSMVLNFLCVLQVWVLARGLGMEVGFGILLAIVPVIICLSALPVTPSGLGVRENLFVLMLAAPPLVIPATLALSLSLLAYAGSLAWSLVGGVAYLLLRGREHLDDVEGAGLEKESR